MLKKAYLPMLFQLFYTFSLSGQVTNIQAKHDSTKEQYIISYDLTKLNAQHYYDIEITASIGGVKVRPSITALQGAVGRHIKAGKRRQIVWNYFVDIEKIIGPVTFEVKARNTAIPALPKPKLDIVLGTSIGSVGMIMTAMGTKTILKKGKINHAATLEEDPIGYYYTVCAENSPRFNATLARRSTENTSSVCDSHYVLAQKTYKAGVNKSAIGLALMAGGLFTLLKKPFNQSKVKAHRQKYNLSFQPTFNWEQALPNRQGIVGMQMQYQFGG